MLNGLKTLLVCESLLVGSLRVTRMQIHFFQALVDLAAIHLRANTKKTDHSTV